MAVTMTKMGTLVGATGLLSFVFGILAEVYKPAAGVPIVAKGLVICKYPSDPTLVYAGLSLSFLVVSSLVAVFSLFYSYKGRKAPSYLFFKSSAFNSFFTVTMFAVGLAASLLLGSMSTHRHPSFRMTGDQNAESVSCPTAKTGVLGGGAFVALNSSLLWLCCFILASNIREDHFEELDSVAKPKHIGKVEAGDATNEDDA